VWTALAVSLPLGAITLFLMTIAWKARANKITTGPQAMIGEIGMAQTRLDPYGKVFVHGEIWDARSAAPVAAGQRIVVRRVQDLQLEVDLVVEPATVLA
jgi:membrane-bound serine protease (ClpP class)